MPDSGALRVPMQVVEWVPFIPFSAQPCWTNLPSSM